MNSDKENKETEIVKEDKKAKVEVYSEIAESKPEKIDNIKGLALAYAKYLKEKDLKPGDVTFAEEEDLNIEESPSEEKAEVAAETKEPEQTEEKPKEKPAKKRRQPRKFKHKSFEESYKGIGLLSRIIEKRDGLQIGLDDKIIQLGRDFATTTHKVASTYRHSRRSIGAAMLSICIIASSILIIFDKFTVYEYAYNGKVLGYVKEQEEVTDVLGIAGEKLTENSRSTMNIEFVPNQNVTFNLVDAGGKSLDDADTAVNKLVYMTDIETEAYGIFDGGNLVTIVKSEEDAAKLLDSAIIILSEPDQGMSLVSASFDNDVEVRPLNVLLTSVQDQVSALRQLTKGGEMEVYHIVEDGEDIESLQETFAVEAKDIYSESNSAITEDVSTGDTVRIHRSCEPVSVTMVERGRLRETVEFKTVKKETDKYYKGDTIVEQEGRDGVQIFEGSITKKSGVEIDRKETGKEVVRKVQDKIILVGTAERPKSAPTGTFAMPIDTFVHTSGYGPRWGRIHRGIDLAARTGTPIYASDGGTVTRAGWYSSYGQCVEIDHGNGKVTRYAHCSRILVSAGEKVYQRQNIALVGNTGNSYGSHLHFEIMVNGNHVDPAPYVGLRSISP